MVHLSSRPVVVQIPHRLPVRKRNVARRWAALLGSALLGGCDTLKLGVMGHAGPVADAQWHLYVILAIVLIFVAGPVLLLVPIFAWHYRLANRNSAYKPEWIFSWPIEGLIWIPPIGIVVGLAFVLWNYTHVLDPYRPILSTQAPLEIQAVALDWKWVFIYPREGVATVNLLAVPVGRPVHISLTSGTVMQSMLVPRLAGQIYAMAGMTTQLNFAADRAGVYHGQNTQYNGDGFPQDRFDVVAMPQAQYARWLARVRAVKRPLDAAAYARLTQRSVVARPIGFSAVPAGFFHHLLVQAQEPKR